MALEKIIGIDLGTSNSAAAVLEAGRPVIVPSAEGASQYGKAFPSYVAISRDGSRLVGEPAKRQAVANPDGTVTAFKRKMGQDFKYRIHGKDYSPQELSAMLLSKIKADAESFLGTPIRKAVITVPAYFNDNQRQATKDAGEIAGLEVVRLVNEPTAACLAYGLDKNDKEMKIMVFDLGGGTLDVTIMDFGGKVFEVKATSGDTQLGGTDMDNTLVNYLTEEFRKQHGFDLSKDDAAVQRLKEAAEKAKIELSTVLETDISLPYLTADNTGPKHFMHKLTRAKLEQLLKPIIDRCRHPVEQALKDAKMSAKDVEKVIMVGGPTRMPSVQKFVEEITGKKPERGVDPMECVAMGAAVQAGVLAGEVKDILLLDVTPLSLGIETLGGITTKLIERNTTIPTRRSQVFSTAADMQTSVDIRVLQGERPMAADNVELGRFSLVGIPPSPRGVPQIEVAFDIDANGILHVSAKDLGTGKEQKMQIIAPNKMDRSEIERKMREAEQHAEEDKAKRDVAESRNELEALAYSAEKTVSDLKEQVTEEEKKSIAGSVEKSRKLLSDANAQPAEFRRQAQELKSVLEAVGKRIYEKTGGAGPGAQGGTGGAGFGGHGPTGGGHSGGNGGRAGGPSGDDNVVDGKYTKE